MTAVPSLRHWIALAGIFLLSPTAWAGEGMWTFDQGVLDRIEAKLGIRLTQQWLDHVRLSSPRIAGSCSASFVSPHGLVMTNHHCAQECIGQVSTAEQDYEEHGFLAKAAADERLCPSVELNQLVSITDVTEEVAAAIKDKRGVDYNKALNAITAEIEARCGSSASVRCDVVTLFRGGAYKLYRYKRFQDVRLVFAPETAAGLFGGEPDNFTFPRYSFDVAFLRVHQDGRPLDTSGHYLRWSESGAPEGSATFIAGNPASTGRFKTLAQIEFDRDVALPRSLLYYAELRGYLTALSKQSAAHKRITTSRLYEIENALKEGRYEQRFLLNPRFATLKAAEEADFRARVAQDSELKDQIEAAWQELETALQRYRIIYDRHTMLERSRGFSSTLFKFARTLVRAADELAKPNSERLPEFRDSNLAAIKQELVNSSPIHGELEIATLAFSLTKLREELGADAPLVSSILDGNSPDELAAFLITGTTLREVDVRAALFEGGAPAIASSPDPMIAFARDKVNAPAMEIRRRYEREVEAVVDRASEVVARARFKIYKSDSYPDATETLRLTFGRVAGIEGEQPVPAFATIGGAFRRHTGQPPFKLPESWLSARSRLQLDLPLTLITTHDVIGGNSGSPVINESAEIVGVMHDSNLPSLGAYYGYDEQTYRAISVHSGAIQEILRKVYGADTLADELSGSKPKQQEH
jgi:hypothetical protein